MLQNMPFGRAVLSHKYPDGTEKPIAYPSRTLNKNEINYSQVDKEGASIIFALKKINQYFLGNNFTLTTDNKAIKKYLTSRQKLTVSQLADLLDGHCY